MSDVRLHRDNIRLVFDEQGEAPDSFNALQVTPHILSYTISSSYTQLTDAFTVSFFNPNPSPNNGFVPFPVPLRRVKIYINDYLQVDGIIDKHVINNTGVITISGRDYLSLLVDSYVEHATLKKGEPLATAILRVTKPFGIDTIEPNGYNEVRTERSGGKANYDGSYPKDPKTIKIEETKTQPNERAFEFLRRVTQRAGVLIQPGQKRNSIALVTPVFSQESIYGKDGVGFKRTQNGGNIIDGTVTRDYTHVPTYMEVHTKRTLLQTSSPVTVGGITIHPTQYESASFVLDVLRSYAPPKIKSGASPGAAFKAEGLGFDELNRIMLNEVIEHNRRTVKKPASPDSIYKPFFLKDSDSRSIKEAAEFARRSLINRLKETLVCEYEVEGHSDPETGAIYTIDTVTLVNDEVGFVSSASGVMWIEEVTFQYSQGGGATTKIKLISPNTFTLD